MKVGCNHFVTLPVMRVKISSEGGNTMQQSVNEIYKSYIVRNSRRAALKKSISVLGCLVVFITTYILILPAITMEQQTFCGLEEHTHNESCYYAEPQRRLICTPEKGIAHVHDESCLDAEGTLVCTWDESEPHVHNETCYEAAPTEEPVLHVHSEACMVSEKDQLICTTEEYEGHTHSDACYVVGQELNCQITEAHIHGDDCYVKPLICTESVEPHVHGEGCTAAGNLICDITEGHVHDESCNSETDPCLIPENHSHDASCYETICVCGREEGEVHVHGDACYSETPELICTIPEGHIHNDSCYNLELICTVEEDPGHSHGDSCYSWIDVISCGMEEGEPEPTEPAEPILICNEVVAEVHVHSDACFEEIIAEPTTICGIHDGEHTHTSLCYNVVCGLEEHKHDVPCYSDPTADVETAAKWEATFSQVELTGNWPEDVLAIARTQLGYTESTKNYEVRENGDLGGYTRYGAWYGIPYGDWCAMFVSFCLDYAEVEGMPLNSGVRPWIQTLTTLELYHKADVYEPQVGDLIFFDWKNDGLSDHVGLVAELIHGENGNLSKIKTIEGNSSNCVRYVEYDIDDSTILGYSELPDNPEYYHCGIVRHIHNEYCLDIDGIPTCQQEEHIHTEECKTAEVIEDTRIDVTTLYNSDAFTGDWQKDIVILAQSQVGYQESTENIVTEEDGTVRGYSCYGDWFGQPYGDWSGMFASFCVCHSGITPMPQSHDVQTWITELTNQKLYHNTEAYMPVSGDLVFYDLDNDGIADHIGIIEQVASAEGDASAQIKAIAGDVDNAVSYLTHAKGDAAILGFSELPDNPAYYVCGIQRHVHNEYCTDGADCQLEEHSHDETCLAGYVPPMVTHTVETENYIVTVFYDPGLNLPEGAEFRVMEYAKDSETYQMRCEEAGTELAWLMNIGFYLGEEELELDGQFNIQVTSKSSEEDPIECISHFTDDGIENLDVSNAGSAETGENTLTFASTGFSDFGGNPNARVLISGTGKLFTFQVLGPNDSFVQGEQYAVYYLNGDQVQFLTARNGSNSIGPYSTDFWSSPKTGGSSWQAYQSNLGNNDSFFWTATDGDTLERSGYTIDVKQKSSDNANAWRTFQYYYWVSNRNVSINNNTQLMVARVSYQTTGRNFPAAPSTGTISVNRYRFYNFAETLNNTLTVLPGVFYQITGTTSSGQSYSFDVESGSSSSVMIPVNIPAGSYTITQVAVPEGYIGDVNPDRQFTIASNGEISFGTEGATFICHQDNLVETDKIAEVEDYNHRTYQIMMDAQSHIYDYDMEDVDVLFVIDQSNSMLFPSVLNETGVTITLSTTNTGANDDILEAKRKDGTLDANELYYIIADPKETATVYALWYDGSAWIYQDASYYAKMYNGNGPGYQSAGEVADYAQNTNYQQYTDANSDPKKKCNGGAIAKGMGDSTLSKAINAGNTQFMVYRAGKTADGQILNRLHYLESAVVSAIYQLASINQDNQVGIMEFTKVINNDDIKGPLKLNDAGVQQLVSEVTDINTSGGTRQDLALAKANELLTNKYHKTANYTYTILITDGAPVKSDDRVVGTYTDQAGANTIYGQMKYSANQVKTQSQLMTVALGLEIEKGANDIIGGSEALKEIATGGANGNMWYNSNDASTLLAKLGDMVFRSLIKKEYPIEFKSTIVDEISNSFYPIAWCGSNDTTPAEREILYTVGEQTDDKKPASGSTPSAGARRWYILQPGDWITLQGKYVPESSNEKAGQLKIKEDGTYYIEWVNQDVGSQAWSGTFYVQAKEDFIGGNAIDTNKSAYMTVGGTQKPYETPTVNVRLLDMNEQISEVTVYLGDNISPESDITSPGDTVIKFYNETLFTKVHADQADYSSVMNDPAPADSTGLNADSFYLKYAMGGLTQAQWDDLKAGKSVEVEYTYDDSSSHGPVGYFTFKLIQTGTGASLEAHQAQHACQPDGTPLSENCENPAETYTLQIVYTAYRLGANGRPATTVHNVAATEADPKGIPTNNPDIAGIRVGGPTAGNDIDTGLGTLTKNNIHEVHVISGKIVITKTLTEHLANALKAKDLTEAEFTFNLEMSESDSVDKGKIVKTQDGPYVFQYGATEGTAIKITVPLTEGQTTYSASVTVENLPRGTYKLTEEEGDYSLKSMEVGTATNSYYAVDTGNVTFKMGLNLSAVDVIGKAENAIYTSYVDAPNGVYGEVAVTNDADVYEGKVPVQKVWSDGLAHTDDTVHVVLYKNDGQGGSSIVTDSNNAAKVLKLTGGNWSGEFTVPLLNADDTISAEDYEIREVTIVDQNTPNAVTGVLENDGTTTVYFTESNNSWIQIGGKYYIAVYSVETETTGGSEEGSAKNPEITWVVTNHVARELPESGGMGTHVFTISGLLLMSAALMYMYFLQRRKKA